MIREPRGNFDEPGEANRPLYQPPLWAVEADGAVELTADAMGADGLNVYVRPAGESEWRLLAVSARRFPVSDRAPSRSGRSERREYRAVGVFDAEEIGRSSGIVTAVWRRRRKKSGPLHP